MQQFRLCELHASGPKDCPGVLAAVVSLLVLCGQRRVDQWEVPMQEWDYLGGRPVPLRAGHVLAGRLLSPVP